MKLNVTLINLPIPTDKADSFHMTPMNNFQGYSPSAKISSTTTVTLPTTKTFPTKFELKFVETFSSFLFSNFENIFFIFHYLKCSISSSFASVCLSACLISCKENEKICCKNFRLSVARTSEKISFFPSIFYWFFLSFFSFFFDFYFGRLEICRRFSIVQLLKSRTERKLDWRNYSRFDGISSEIE